MPGKIDLFYYGDVGSYDTGNPYFAFRRSRVPEILFLIASHGKYELSASDIASKLAVSQEDILPGLMGIEKLGMVTKQDENYTVTFPVVLEYDLPILNSLSNSMAEPLVRKIVSHRREIEEYASGISCSGEFDLPRILYHVVGCDFLDGSAMVELGNRDLIRTSKKQYDSRDYILFGYEESDVVRETNDRLLCSRNRAGQGTISFVSFGDCNGNRNDLFRFIKQAKSRIGNISTSEELNCSYLPLFEKHVGSLLIACSDLVCKIFLSPLSPPSLNTEESEIADFLRNLNYIDVNGQELLKTTVPVFQGLDHRIISDLSDYLMELLEKDIAEGLARIGENASDLSAVRHGIDDKEIANDLWHHVLGKVNQRLIGEGMMADPEFRAGEGRYLQAIYAGSERG
ncbi:MAG: hypothetical protein GF388_01045 [Candidatus Aegiribacteria sp.]|nr:hypothetical protein [Candidatus Aegiribacteria sp.]